MGSFILGAKMSKELKYVMMDIQPILFSKMQQHSDFKHIGKITSAGFCYITYDEENYKFNVTVHGSSVSLKLESNPDDARLIELILNEY